MAGAVTIAALAIILYAAISLLRWAHDDFYGYLAVGRGGSPSTFRGWCQAKVLSLVAHGVFQADVLGAPFLDPRLEPYRGQLFALPQRGGGFGRRPTIVGLVPQRHPLACCADHWLWRYYHHAWKGTRLPLPATFVPVYAPRDGDEMAVFERIVDAAVWFHTLPEGGGGARPACCQRQTR